MKIVIVLSTILLIQDIVAPPAPLQKNEGIDAKGQFPYQVLIRLKHADKYPICNGIIVEINYVLTTASCVEQYASSAEGLQIMAGGLSSMDTVVFNENVQDRDIHQIIVHPTWYDSYGKSGDIALLKVFPDFRRTSSVSIANLTTEAMKSDNQNIFVIGCGVTKKLTYQEGEINNDDSCQKLLKSKGSRSVFCIRMINQKHPLHTDNFNGAAVKNTEQAIIGIVSSSVDGFATDLFSYKLWIDSNIKKTDNHAQNTNNVNFQKKSLIVKHIADKSLVEASQSEDKSSESDAAEVSSESEGNEDTSESEYQEETSTGSEESDESTEDSDEETSESDEQEESEATSETEESDESTKDSDEETSESDEQEETEATSENEESDESTKDSDEEISESDETEEETSESKESDETDETNESTTTQRSTSPGTSSVTTSSTTESSDETNETTTTQRSTSPGTSPTTTSSTTESSEETDETDETDETEETDETDVTDDTEQTDDTDETDETEESEETTEDTKEIDDTNAPTATQRSTATTSTATTSSETEEPEENYDLEYDEYDEVENPKANNNGSMNKGI